VGPWRRRRKTVLAVAIGVVVGVVAPVVLLCAGGIANWTLTGHGGPKPHIGNVSDAAASWGVGSCVYLSKDFPHPTPSAINPDVQRIIEQSKEYQPISCSDPRAIARITALGAHVPPNQPIEDSGCPDDSDIAVRTKTVGLGAVSDSQVYCLRNLKAPHPGDPGGGGGGLVVDDCVFVASSNAARPLNDRVAEVPCANGYFAKVLARTRDRLSCPAATLSRIPYGISGDLLCLGQADTGLIAKPGDCVWTPANYYQPAVRTRCAHTAMVYPLVAMADAAARCPKGTHGHQYTGYDRWLCVRLPDGS
jgi:hypothetical protein